MTVFMTVFMTIFTLIFIDISTFSFTSAYRFISSFMLHRLIVCVYYANFQLLALAIQVPMIIAVLS